jgi:mannose-6-phosphate isomerase-like protein (cupin superfamily)
MHKINVRDVPEDSWSSPKGKFEGTGTGISEALGRKPSSTDLMERHPFDVEILRISLGKTPYPCHSHSAQWEFYHAISGKGKVRHKDGTTAIEAGDAFIFEPGQPHQFTTTARRTSSSTSLPIIRLANHVIIPTAKNGPFARPSAG